MAVPRFGDDQLILAARLYFLEGVSQARIGELVNVSQAKVSRMLALARERGLVRISVPDYEPRDPVLEGELGRALGVDAVVIRSVSGPGGGDPRPLVGHFAAPAVGGWLDAAGVVAVSGGRTVRAVVENMGPSDGGGGLELVQAMGTIDANPGPYDASELARTLAHRRNGTFLTLNSPAFLPDADTCRRFLGLEPIRRVLGRLADADLALVGIGTLENSVFLERGALGPRDIGTLREAGAVGEILGRFFDPKGDECPTPYRDRVVSLGLDVLRRIPRRAGVVAGADRAGAVLAAIRGGLLNSLVIDEGGARALLEKARDPSSSASNAGPRPIMADAAPSPGVGQPHES